MKMFKNLLGEVKEMLGLLINKMEKREMEYMVKSELEEIRIDLEDTRIDNSVKAAMKDRYHVLFQLLRRLGNEKDCIKYMPKASRK
ncbi:hypothetical protein ACDI16_11720 [Oceanobacillus caeni]